MNAIPDTAETRAAAARIIWFEPPERTLADPRRLLAYVFRYATHRDMQTLRRHVSDGALRDALETAPPGIIDARSWAYWRLMLDLPPEPLPFRRLA